MKHTIKLFIAMTAMAFCVSASAEQTNSIEVEVNGLVCAFCAQGITSAFSKEPETQDVLVSLEHRLVAIELKPNADMTDARVTEVLVDAGYDVVGMQRSQRSIAMIRDSIDDGSSKHHE